MADYTNAAQQRVLQLLLRLAGHEVDGLAPGELAKALSTTPSNITRDLFNMQAAGVAEQVQESGRWRLSPRVPQIGVAMLNGIGRAQSKIDEVQNRFTRT